MVFAIPAGMRQALIRVIHQVSPCGFTRLIKPHKEKLSPGTLKAFQVSLVEPVAYPLGFTVITAESSASGRVWVDKAWIKIGRIRVLGQRFRFLDDVVGDDVIPEFYARQIQAFGPEIQRLLKRLHVGVIGAGGTGSAVIEQLVRLGVGTLSIFDGDEFEASNVSRVYGSSVADGGKNKAKIASEHTLRMGLGTVVHQYNTHIVSEHAARSLRECDVIFSCVDKHAPRGILVQLALRYLIPVFDTAIKIDAEEGVIRGIYGRVTTLLPGEACLFCRGRISSRMIALESLEPEEWQALADEAYAPQLETENPAVIAFTTAVASQAVFELLHRLTGYMGENRLSSEVLMLFHENTVRTNRTPAGPGCLCRQVNLWGKGDGRDYLGLMWPEAAEGSPTHTHST